MDPYLLSFTMAFDIHPGITIPVLLEYDKLIGDAYLPFYNFEGRELKDFTHYGGFWCYYKPGVEECFMYFGESADFSKTVVPAQIERLAALLGYKLFLTPDPEAADNEYRSFILYMAQKHQLPLFKNDTYPDDHYE